MEEKIGFILKITADFEASKYERPIWKEPIPMVTPINPAKISLKKSFLFTFLISLKEIDKKISPLIKNLKKPKPIKVNRITPSTINLESARESARTSAKEGMAGIRSAAKSVGSPNYMNEVIAGNIGTQRELGKILTQSYLAEQTTNAAAKDEAARANLAAELQAQGIDTARLDKYADTKAALTSNLFTLPAMGVSEYLGQKNLMDAAQMNSPYEITTSPTSRWKRQFRIKKEGK